MPFTRRQVLTLTGTSLLLSIFAWWPRREHPPEPVSRQEDALRAWLDTLLPAEADFPGAVALGVSERIAAAIAREPAYARLTAAAMAWLAARTREAGGTTFAALPEARRVDMVAAAAASPEGSTPRTFFQATLDDALFHVYADARSWTGLAYAGPPQPIGFPDQAAAPRSD
ncbi:MAG: gluconate 2-dehydrogenase subunit 3 family protein [Accumulibacter sp.]|jgi:hypothetical protein|uniref:gluconate 2-dehydrogenase subunit 3 family protein n=1 Tax=Accumulibacter sp. TaxID=2053492 RepID=UPI002FC37477